MIRRLYQKGIHLDVILLDQIHLKQVRNQYENNIVFGWWALFGDRQFGNLRQTDLASFEQQLSGASLHFPKDQRNLFDFR